jgi:hypothetical protein
VESTLVGDVDCCHHCNCCSQWRGMTVFSILRPASTLDWCNIVRSFLFFRGDHGIPESTLQICMNELMHTVSVLTQQISVQSSLTYGESDVACIHLEICWKQSSVRPMMITGWSDFHVIKLWAPDLS